MCSEIACIVLLSLCSTQVDDTELYKSLVAKFEKDNDELKRLQIINTLRDKGLDNIHVQGALIDIYNNKMSLELRMRLTSILSEIDEDYCTCIIFLVDHSGSPFHELPAIKKYVRIARERHLSFRALAICISKSRRDLEISAGNGANYAIGIDQAMESYNKYVGTVEKQGQGSLATVSSFPNVRYQVASTLYYQNVDDIKTMEYYLDSIKSKSNQVLYTAVYLLARKGRNTKEKEIKERITESIVKCVINLKASASPEIGEEALSYLLDIDYKPNDKNVMLALNRLTSPTFSLTIRERASKLATRIGQDNKKQ